MADHVTISDTDTRETTVIGASPASTTSIGFAFFEENGSDVNVYIDGVLQTDPTHYTITPTYGTEGGFIGGTVNWVTAQSNVTVVTILNIALKRLTDLPTTGKLPVASLNTDLDKLWSVAKQLNESIGRKIGFSVGSSSSATMPEPSANQLLGWNAGATDLENKDPIASGTIIRSNATPAAPAGSGSAGTSEEVSRSDHSHPEPSVLEVGGTEIVKAESDKVTLAAQTVLKRNTGLSGATPAPDMDDGQIIEFTTSANTTFGAPTNVEVGGTYLFDIILGGAHTIAWNEAYKFVDDTAPDTPATNGHMMIGFKGEASNILREINRSVEA